jgi:hypothetical protein
MKKPASPVKNLTLSGRSIRRPVMAAQKNNKGCKLYIDFVALLGAMVFLSCGVQGCSMEEMNDFNAVLYDNAGKWIDLDFQRENLTHGFWDGLYLDGELIHTDESYPNEKIFIITDRAEFDAIFNEFPSGVNFNKEMILLYGITSTNIRPIVIESIKLENERLNIKLKYVSLTPPGEPSEPDATVPQMRWFVVKIDKLNIDTAEFSLSS